MHGWRLWVRRGLFHDTRDDRPALTQLRLVDAPQEHFCVQLQPAWCGVSLCPFLYVSLSGSSRAPAPDSITVAATCQGLPSIARSSFACESKTVLQAIGNTIRSQSSLRMKPTLIDPQQLVQTTTIHCIAPDAKLTKTT
ncbi:uncharacterized protein BDZ99DRAFT_13831 [Mytilinidion resinicola]|uniref:Uncharacterized protein n=1 Tax=Mytilinidion resinicola TaxID=574789 RepID=A0A6A6Z8K8_9PEZI|nr:uncharacterized protein BDZ99DRAFT_13831 [Mytilinidion resinicola]KAF2817346.1 hypothetical protein BDZ99DRAFT_13831 [Mytilinidion resinicola]